MAIHALDRFGLAETVLQRADTLSGGQQQRVAICRALLQEPKLLLADEPIASLDPANARTVTEALRRVNREERITVLTSLHELDTARRYCDRIIAMQAGALVFDGSPAELTAALIRAISGVSEAEVEEGAASRAGRRARDAVPVAP